MDLTTTFECPRCGTEMELIDSTVRDVVMDDLRLCPQCYLVTWRDQTGVQTRQGVPLKEGASGLKVTLM